MIPAGNLSNDLGQQFSYDATGQQTLAWWGSYQLQQNYDGDGLRVKKVDGGTTTLYLRSTVLGGQVVAELSSSGTFTRGYVYLGGQLLAVQQSGAVNWVHEDPITKSKRVTNSSGSLVSAIELDPWGADAGVGWVPGFQPKKFTSYERDGNGSDEAMFRRYNRWHSRFDQPDPYEGSNDLTNPQSFNRYSYVQNDPVNFTDPTGLLPAQCNGTIVTDPTTGQSTCIPIISGGTVTITAGPISIQDDPTTYRFVLGSIFSGFGGGRQVGGGAGPQDPSNPTIQTIITLAQAYDPESPCFQRAPVENDLINIAKTLGGKLGPPTLEERFPGGNIDPKGQSYADVVNALDQAGFSPNLALDHPEGKGFQKQFEDGLWFHVIVNFPTSTVVRYTPRTGSETIINPQHKTPLVTAHCHGTDPSGIVHTLDELRRKLF